MFFFFFAIAAALRCFSRNYERAEQDLSWRV